MGGLGSPQARTLAGPTTRSLRVPVRTSNVTLARCVSRWVCRTNGWSARVVVQKFSGLVGCLNHEPAGRTCHRHTSAVSFLSSAPVAQLDRVPAFEAGCCRFESASHATEDAATDARAPSRRARSQLRLVRDSTADGCDPHSDVEHRLQLALNSNQHH